MKFKDTIYGDLTGQKIIQDIKINDNLTSLEGSPEEINGDFNVRLNELTSLEGSPKIVDGDFRCDYNVLETLKGSPEIVTGDYCCSYNKKLTSLEGCSKNIFKSLIFEGIKAFKNKEKIKQEIIKHQIKAKKYVFNSLDDNSTIFFEDIQEEFKEYKNQLKKQEEKEKLEKIKQQQKNKLKEYQKIKSKIEDYGLYI